MKSIAADAKKLRRDLRGICWGMGRPIREAIVTESLWWYLDDKLKEGVVNPVGYNVRIAWKVVYGI